MRLHGIAALLILLPTLFLTYRLPAQDKKHPIDVWLDKAIEKDSTTHGMRRATAQATEKWDAELNKVYKKLLAALKPDQKAALVKSQKAWIAYRDAEIATIREIIGKKDGTMWPVVAGGNVRGLTKDRALQLQGYLDEAKD